MLWLARAEKAVLRENEPGDMSGHLCCSGSGEKEMHPVHLAPWVLAARRGK